MSLDPQISAILHTLDSGFPPVHTMTGADARAVIASRYVAPADPEPVDSVVDLVADGTAIRIYRPTASGPLPVLVFAHGGGFVFCGLDSHDGLCRTFANLLGAIVVSVDYRLAPEHRYPAAAEDVYAVTQWVAAHAAELGGDPTRLLVGGDSAGGNLAAATTLMTRDRGGAPLIGQALLYPVLAADFGTESYCTFATGYYNTAAAMRWYWDQYAPSAADRESPYATPLHAELEGLPPAVIAVAGHDPLRDEALAYSAALRNAGVPVTELCYQGAIHGFLSMPILDLTQRARREVCEALHQILSR